ncbi:MAG: hypothetical protein IT426_05830 [Pirellulales bacterium]|nr:hypothetical protein [Pirellulales bacterium]
MKIWPIAAIGLTCLLIAGCRTDPAIQLLERDNRRLEDEIYRLRACVEDYESGMIPTGAEVASTKSSRPRERDEDRESPAAAPRNRDLPSGAATTPPSVEIELAPENEVPGIKSRTNRPPAHSPAPAKAPAAFDPPRNSRAMPAAEPAGPALGGASEEEPIPPGVPAENMSYVPPPKGDSFKAVQIVLHNPLCTASERDGIRVVFEPRDRLDRRVDAAADVSIVLIDPSLVPRGSKITPPEARIARWDFPADAVASMFRGTSAGKVISIEAPWPGAAPMRNKLLLFVRYTTRDGRKLVAGNLPIVIARSQDRTARAEPPERLQPVPEETSGPTLSREEPPPRTSAEEAAPLESAALPPEVRRDSARTATRENAPRLQRPVWSPERR